MSISKEQVVNDMLEILEIADVVVDKTEAFQVKGSNEREWRISVLSVAKIVQEQMNFYRLHPELITKE